jgi:hypothetical protein
LPYIWVKQQLENASTQEESMSRQICLLALGIVAILLTFFPAQSIAYERDTIFQDDFNSGSLENWQVVLGEWLIDDAKLCQLSCSA